MKDLLKDSKKLFSNNFFEFHYSKHLIIYIINIEDNNFNTPYVKRVFNLTEEIERIQSNHHYIDYIEVLYNNDLDIFPLLFKYFDVKKTGIIEEIKTFMEKIDSFHRYTALDLLLLTFASFVGFIIAFVTKQILLERKKFNKSIDNMNKKKN